MINSINGFESNLNFYNTNTNFLKENSIKQKEQLTQENSNIKEQNSAKEQSVNQTNESKSKQNLKTTEIKEQPKSQEDIAKDKARFRKYFYQSGFDTLREFIKVNDNEVDWKEKSIAQLEELLNKKFTKEEQDNLYKLDIRDIAVKEDPDLLIDNSLVTWLYHLREKVAQNGKLSIWDRRAGWGTEQQRQELEDFFNSLPLGGAISSIGENLLNNYFDEDITEFKSIV